VDEQHRIETLCAQAREDLPGANQPLIAPIYQSAVWTLDSVEQCESVYGGELPGYIYTRDANPNHTALERVIAALEHAPAGVIFGTGMAALSATLTAFTGAGSRVVAGRQLYGATSRLLAQELGRFGVETAWADVTDLEAVEAALAPGAALLLVETLANPLLQVADLPRLADLCRRHGARLVVDNTFASPVCCRPLDHGADLVIHSVTKFLGGHSDLTLGAAAGSVELVEELRRQARLFGGAANPFESWLALRGITTLPLRMERSCSNAAALAARLEAHPRVRRVFYPGLPSHPQHDLAGNLLQAPGAMLAFELADGEAASALLRRLKQVRFAPSLGDTATTISYPVATSHRGLSPEEWREAGITEGLLRLSVGIDHVDDVWADLEEALSVER
jgi:cystathionine beta-lyase/cystathionine gamma-synthase